MKISHYIGLVDSFSEHQASTLNKMCVELCDIYVEERPAKAAKDNGVLHYDPIGRSWVKLTGVIVSIIIFFVFSVVPSALSCFGRARFFFLPILVPHSLFSFPAT